MNSRNHIEMQNGVTFAKKNFKINILKIKNYLKVRVHYHYKSAEHNMCNLQYSVPKKVLIGFHNRSNYDYYFIINELVEEF